MVQDSFKWRSTDRQQERIRMFQKGSRTRLALLAVFTACAPAARAPDTFFAHNAVGYAWLAGEHHVHTRYSVE